MAHYARPVVVGPVTLHHKNDMVTVHKVGCAHTLRGGEARDHEVEMGNTYGDDFFEVAPCAVDKATPLHKCFGRWYCTDPNCVGDR